MQEMQREGLFCPEGGVTLTLGIEGLKEPLTDGRTMTTRDDINTALRVCMTETLHPKIFGRYETLERSMLFDVSAAIGDSKKTDGEIGLYRGSHLIATNCVDPGVVLVVGVKKYVVVRIF